MKQKNGVAAMNLIHAKEIQMKVIITSVLIIFIQSTFSYAQNIINLGIASDDPTSKISARILEKAYKRINIKMNFVELPAERSLMLSNNGSLDGEVNRIVGIDKTYPGLIMVPVPINYFEAVVFTKNHDFQVNNWDSIKPYTIAIRRGIKFAEHGTEGMNVTKFSSDDKIFILVSEDRYDVCISTRIIGLYQIRKHNLFKLKVLSPPLASFKLYHYMHKSHKDIVPKIRDVLQEMEKEGAIQNERELFIKKLLKPNSRIK